MAFEVLRRFALPVAAAIAVVGGAGLAVSVSRSGPGQVKVRAPFQWKLTSDATPIRTDLYRYAGDAGDTSGFKTSGPPLSFRFPRSYHPYEENQRGGAQASIWLSADRSSLAPLPARVAREKRISGSNTIEMSYGEYRDRDLLIAVKTNATMIFAGRGVSLPDWLVDYYKPAGAACGARFYSYQPRQPANRPPLTIDGLDLNYQDLIGERWAAGGWRGFECSRASQICRVAFEQKGLEVSFAIPKNELCRFEQYILRIRTLLDRFSIKPLKEG